MQATSSPIYAFNSSVEAEEILRSLGRSGFAMESVTRVGASYLSKGAAFDLGQLSGPVESADDIMFIVGSAWRSLAALFTGKPSSCVVFDRYGLMLSNGRAPATPGRMTAIRAAVLKSV